jgi:hypothetical protein
VKFRSAVRVVYTSDAGTPPDYDLLPFVERNIGERFIYLADNRSNCYNLENLQKKYDVSSLRPIWKIEPKKDHEPI